MKRRQDVVDNSARLFLAIPNPHIASETLQSHLEIFSLLQAGDEPIPSANDFASLRHAAMGLGGGQPAVVHIEKGW